MEDRIGLMQEVDEVLVDDIKELVEQDGRGMVLNIILDLHAADQAALIQRLPSEAAHKVFDWLPNEDKADLLLELDNSYRLRFIEDMDAAEIADVMDEMDSDDAVEVLGELPDKIAESILPEMEDEEGVREQLGYEEDTAGRLMSNVFVAVPDHWTVADTTEEVRRQAEEVDPIYVVYVLDANQQLMGLVSLKQLLLSPSHTKISEIAVRDYVSVTPDVDQEEVARIMERYDLTVLPVTDMGGELLGRITIDDIVDVIREEAEEDLQRLSGISSGDEELSDSVFQISRGRLPWLLIGLTGSMVSAFVIGNFVGILEKIAVLAMFIPVIGSTAGNVGVQSAAIAVQGIASGNIWASDLTKRIIKEVTIAFLNGLSLAIAIGLVIVVFKYSGWPRFHDVELAHLIETVGTALVICILMAATIGSGVPLLLYRFKIDPAIATGPFVTTSNDILGVLIYFTIARLVYF